MRRVTGQIVRFFSDRGFGFVTHESGVDHFFHLDSVGAGRERLRIGTELEYTPEDAPKGPRAIDCEVLR